MGPPSPSGGGRRGQRPGDLLRPVALDDVPNLDVVEVLDPDAALEALAHLADVVLEAAERRDGTVVHRDAVADDARAVLPRDDAVPHEAPSHDADARHAEELP